MLLNPMYMYNKYIPDTLYMLYRVTIMFNTLEIFSDHMINGTTTTARLQYKLDCSVVRVDHIHIPDRQGIPIDLFDFENGKL